MLAVFIGDNVEKRQEAFQKFLGRFSEYEMFEFDDTSVSEELLVQSLLSVPMFAKGSVVVLRNVLETFDLSKEVFEGVKNGANLIILERDLKGALKTKLKKKADVFEEFKELKKIASRFSPFALTDALLQKNKKSMWVEYQKALLEGVDSNELVPPLLWQVKAMALVSSVKEGGLSQSETGLKPFVYNKAKQSLSVYSNKEISDIHFKLVSLYHNSRRGLDLKDGLEEFFLS